MTELIDNPPPLPNPWLEGLMRKHIDNEDLYATHQVRQIEAACDMATRLQAIRSLKQ